jgi:galactitol PTS system EIIA component
MPNIILQLLEPSAIKLHLDASDSQSVITTLGGLLYKAGYVKDSFPKAAWEREQHLPTGLPLSGDVNAAIPHTDVVHVNKPGLSMATLKKPVIFKNMVSPEESVPVQLVFVLALDQPKAQVEMLMEIAKVLQNPKTIESLMKSNNYQDVQSALSGA